MSDKVYCTADGEWPPVNQIVMFEDDGDCYIGGFNGGYWFDQNEYQLYETGERIYWKPLTSLKDEYERQRGQTD